MIYAALAWGGVEVVTTLGPVLEFSDGLIRGIVIAILAGLPVAIVLAWVFDVTPEGVRSDASIRADDGGDRAHGAAAAGATSAQAGGAAGGTSGGTSGEAPGRTPDAAPLHRPPPAALSRMVGRDADVSGVVERLAGGARLVTVTGPGGTGKTTLAAEVARRSAADFPGGLIYFTLVGVPTADEVMPSLAMALDVADVEGRAPVDGLAKVIGDRRLLLVLDNFEHVVDAAPDCSTLLAACPHLQILATSRSPLRIAGEEEYALAPLALPAAGAEAIDDILDSPAVELFVARARQARPDFTVDGTNATSIGAICRRLDGLPLALELAAARVRVLEPAALLERLEHALDVLTSGARDLPERQRTLRATVDWSHSLLNDDEQRLFRRLAVFADGWTHEAAEAVCDPDDAGDVLEEMTSLIEKGLVSRDGAHRFTMLQTILDFALEKLAASEESERFRALHAEYYKNFADRLEHGLQATDGGQLEWMERGGREDGNLNAALAWLRNAAASGDADRVEDGLATCGSLMLYWHIRAQHVRMLDRVNEFLEHRGDIAPTAGWSAALSARALASMSVGDVPSAIVDGTTSVEAADAVGFDRGSAFFPWILGSYYLMAGDFAGADTWLDLGANRCRELEWDWGEGVALAFGGMSAMAQGRTEAARQSFHRALELLPDGVEFEGRGVTLSGLAMLTLMEGDPQEALRLYEEARVAFVRVGDRPEVARVLDEAAWCALGAGSVEQARAHFLESLREHDAIASSRGVGLALMGLAAVEVAEGRVERGLVVSAAADAFSEKEGVVVAYPWVFSAKERLEEAIAAMPEDDVRRLTERGRGMSDQEAIAFVLERQPAPPSPATSAAISR